MASGSKSKNAVPKIDPEEKLRRTNKILSRVFSFNDKAKMPTNDRMLTAATATNA
jgi:hypothetical protein